MTKKKATPRRKRPEPDPVGLNRMSSEAIRTVLTEIVETARFCHNTPELRLEIGRQIQMFLGCVLREPGPIEICCSEPDDPKSGENSRRFAVWVRVPRLKTSRWASPDLMIGLDPSRELQVGSSEVPSFSPETT